MTSTLIRLLSYYPMIVSSILGSSCDIIVSELGDGRVMDSISSR